MIWPFWRRSPRHPVMRKMTVGQREFGIVDLGSDLSGDLRREIEDSILRRGTPFETGGTVSPAFLPVLGAGGAMASSLFAGNVFLATANPATLMKIGEGVGSAVMGATGIVRQAPFVAAGGAIVPVVAPVVLFAAISAMVICARVDKLQESVEQLAGWVQELLAQGFAEDCGILVSALERVQDISEEFDRSGRFTDEIKIRLALAERDLNVLHHKYQILTEQVVHDRVAVDLAVLRTRLFALSSLADIQVDRLRLLLAVQSNPVDVTRRVFTLDSKIKRYEALFSYLSQENPVILHQEKLQKIVDDMGWWKKNVFSTKEFSQTKAAIDTAAAKVEQIQEILESGADQKTSIVYYRERNGKGDLSRGKPTILPTI